jgi:adenosylcobyric acid synthase
MGVTAANNTEEAEPLPTVMRNNYVYGTYLHGFFDSAPCRDALIRFLRGRKGISPSEDKEDRSGEGRFEEAHSIDLKQYKEEQFDKLAFAIRKELNMKFIYKILEEGL